MVYVDAADIRYGRMIMCHMMADSEEELHDMADNIGVHRRHFQGDHYDVCRDKKSQALKQGAVEVSSRFLVKLRRKNRALG